MQPKRDFDVNDIVGQIRAQIEGASVEASVVNVGRIVTTGDGVVSCEGLSDAAMGEIVMLPENVPGLILNLKDSEVNIVVLGEYEHLQEGMEVRATGRLLSIKASFNLLGRVVNAMGVAIDGMGEIIKDKRDKLMPVEKIAAGVIDRQDVRTPLQTGIKVVDALVPVGRGQRELIIGDRGVGKTAIAVDAIINQANVNKNLQKGEKRVLSIYVAIGQKQAKVAQVQAALAKSGALQDTIIMSATAADNASLQYLAPFTATAIGEYFMEQGEDVLIVYDDLTKHAWAYRQLSLLLKRPSGREAYPGDIFYLHSRLLERSARISDKLGGGSMTALPIIETQAGDISAYIPTNVISITDGQIYLDPDVFYSGVRPAISVGLSVSRVGGDAQAKAMKQVAGKMKLDLAQYRELAAFAQFGSDLDETTQKRLERGKAVTMMMRQPQYQPMAVEEQVLSLWLAGNGYADEIDETKMKEFEKDFIDLAKRGKKSLLLDIRTKKVLSSENEEELKKVAGELLERWK